MGQLPTVTYSARESKRHEQLLNDYLDERGRILVLTGPSKSGKTVLLRKVAPDAIWLAGGNIDSTDRFWHRITDETDSFASESVSEEHEESDTEAVGTQASFKPAGRHAP